MKSVNLGIDVATVSPVAIIEGSETLVGKTVTKIKKEAVFNEDGKIDYIPYIPANGFRGVLRRYATKRVVDAVKANTDDKVFNDRDLHAMLSGSGTNDQPLTYGEAQKIREKNPILSLFGTGLLLGGKLNIANIMPDKDATAVKKDENGKTIFNSLVRVANYTKVDDILQKSKFATLFTTDQIKEWENSVLENSAARSKQRKKNEELKEMKQELDKTVKKESIQHYFGKEYIPSGLKMHSSIRLVDPTKLELGAFVAALIDFANDGTIGSSRNIGFGVIDFSVIDLESGMEIITKRSDENYIFNSIVNTNLELSSSIKEAYDEYMQWLQSVSKESVETISNIA